MNIFKRLRKQKKQFNPANQTTSVVFAGGLGTQILQAAVYFSLKNAGHQVYADLSYFDTESRMAQVGEKGRATHWFWQLDQYGLTRELFDSGDDIRRANPFVLRDGPDMMREGLSALTKPEIQRYFTPRDLSAFSIPEITSERFLCIHVRRGDYVNVASHLVSDSEFLQLAKKFSLLLSHAVLLSDSPFESDFKEKMGQMFQSVTYLDQLDAYSSHWLMRQAQVLVCSNSTYSLTAAQLNPKALVVLPKQWFGPDDQDIELPIQKLCTFQIAS